MSKRIVQFPNRLILPQTSAEDSHLNIHRERVEPHWTNESNSAGKSVHQIVLLVHPEPLQLGENGVSLERLKVTNFHVWHPKIFEYGQVEGSEEWIGISFCRERSVPAVSNNHTTVLPLHDEVSVQSDGEILVRHFRNILDVYTYRDISWCLWRKFKLDVVIG